MYSTWNYTQYPVINHNEKENIYMYITESLSCTADLQVGVEVELSLFAVT